MSAFWSLACFSCTLVCLSVYLFGAPFAHAFLHNISRVWATMILLTNPLWKLEVSGVENIQPGKHYVVAANHQSMLDIFVVLAALPFHFKFMAKKELFPIPVVGWHMFLAGYIAINRKSTKSGKKALDKANDALALKQSVLFYPEGTRSLDGKIKKFKAGAFKAAQENGVSILPVVIDGTGDAVPKKSWVIIKRSCLKVRILKPVAVPKTKTLEESIEKVRGKMIHEQARIKKEAQ